MSRVEVAEIAPEETAPPRPAAPRSPGRPALSVVAPAWNEAETLPLFYRRTAAVLEALGEPWELVLVDDGSADATRVVLRDLHDADPRVKSLSFSRNFGHQAGHHRRTGRRRRGRGGGHGLRPSGSS